ncbi:MAG: branched-chain amino acid ABC transporter permease [Candidatus Cryosericum sp.]|nr:branched-chain amino acid ABC transporter permease [bacterium]
MKKFTPILLLVLALLIPVIFRQKPSLVYYLNLSMIYAISAQGLNLLMGIGGQISLGHAAFMAIGGYTSAVLVMVLHVPFIVALIAGVGLSCLFGLIIGFPALRLKGFYLAIATLAMGTVVTDIIKRIAITGGDYGLRNIPAPRLFGFTFGSSLSQFYLILAGLLLAIVVTRNFIRSKSGIALQAMRDSETGAQAVGINTSNYKLLAFILASAFAGLAGVLYGHSVSYLNTTNFGLDLSINLLAITIIGGMGTVWGVVLGSFLWVFVRNLMGSGLEMLTGVLFGVILLLVVLFLPRGLSEIGFRIAGRFKGKNESS